MKLKIFLFVLAALLFSNCSSENFKEKGSAEYIKGINDWHQKRVERLKHESGWLNLVGLYWLEPGKNSFGSNKSNQLVFPDGTPEFIGNFILKDSSVTAEIFDNPDVKVDNQIKSTILLKSDLEDSTTIISYKSFKWFLIKRGEKFGIRLRDLNAELVKNFPGIKRFPVNEDWKLNAKFVNYMPPKEINIPTIIGTVDVELSPGYVEFEIQNNIYKLDAIKSGDGLFFVFADLTSGEETYGAGRFLYTDGPDQNKNVILDFNKAYNPPCAFSKYATCPLPPEQNKIKLRIIAGEKNFGNH
jgi:uncharacterized protein (DUF1684 family)